MKIKLNIKFNIFHSSPIQKKKKKEKKEKPGIVTGCFELLDKKQLHFRKDDSIN